MKEIASLRYDIGGFNLKLKVVSKIIEGSVYNLGKVPLRLAFYTDQRTLAKH
jgi:hypothetical protein